MSREKLQNLGTKWMERIIQAEKREEDWRKDAEAAEKAYSGSEKALEGKTYHFNILHSNVETIVPSIINSPPVPDIRRRFNDPEDMPAKETGDLLERAITALVDDNKLDKEMERGAQDAFLSGRDIIRLSFDADWEDNTLVDEITGEEQVEPVPRNERILFRAWSWRDFRFGPASRWEDVPWIAFKHLVPREEMERVEDPELLDAQRGPDEITLAHDEEDDIPIWEVWCKQTRTVKFIRENDRKVLKVEDDPLGLKGFFPMPEIVQPITLTGKMTPVCPFSIYKHLADELDLATRRINKIMSGLKVRGLTFGDAKDVLELAQAGDNEIIVASGLEQLAQTKGLDGAIAWWPVETAVAVLAQLYGQREQTKQAIYEITGISDIVRGASDADETLGAQEIKTQWGALRIQKMQRMVERQARDIFGLMTEIISNHFSPETLSAMTGIQVTPEMQQILQDEVERHYRIDVESDSTVRADMTRKRGEMSQFLEGTGAFMSAVGPVIEARPELGEPMSEIYAAFARQFRLGKQAEDALERMGQQAKEGDAAEERPDPEAQKAQMEMQLKQQEMQAQQQARQAELQLKARELQMKAEAEERQAEREARKADQEAQIRAQESVLSAEKARREIAKIEAEIERIKAQAKAADRQPAKDEAA